MTYLHVHRSPLGSGSHSPVSVQVAKLGPMSDNSGGQLKLIVIPSIDKMSSESSTVTLGTESYVDCNNACTGCPQLARKQLLQSLLFICHTVIQ